MTERAPHVLERILASKRAEITAQRGQAPVRSSYEPEGLVFQTLRRATGEPLRLITEIKPRSPSAGKLSSVLSEAQRAEAYARAGAVMISVLVDGPFFGGSYENLLLCRQTMDTHYGANRPRLLCKEFVLEKVQMDWAVGAGADAILLIARIVSADDLCQLVDYANTRGIEPLVEVTNETELQAAEKAGARVIGVNARDLDTLVMDPVRAANVLARIDAERVRVHLSGLVLPDDVARIAQGPADAALVGEALMRQDDPTELLGEMVRRAGGKNSSG